MRKSALLLTVALLSLSVAARAADAPLPQTTTAATFNDAQKAEIENIVKEYLVNKHPEVMAQGLQNLQQKEQQSADAKSKAEITSEKDKIFNDPRTPVGGNPKGDVTIVEFYDFSCGYCKMSEESLERLVKEDKNVKVVYKDFPILGPASAEAAKAALASMKQGKFQPLHDALMTKKDHLTSDMIYATAKDVGIDVDRLKKDMNDSVVADTIAANLKLGQDIGVRGTPMFIVNDNVYPGALQYEQLKQAVSDARGAEKKS